MKKILAGCLVFCCAALMVSAAEQAETNRTTITCDGRLSFDYQRMTAEFEKNVVVVDANMRLQADKLNVVFDSESNIKQAVAVGHVKLWQQDKVGTCHKAIFVARTGEIMLIGEAQIKRGNDVIKGDKITFWINEDRMVCEPGNLIFTPRKNSGLPGFGTGAGKQ